MVFSERWLVVLLVLSLFSIVIYFPNYFNVYYYFNFHLSNIYSKIRISNLFAHAQGDQYLYDPALLAQLNFERSVATFRPKITAVEPGAPWMVVRPLKETDYDRGFLQLLGQLTSVGDISRGEFLSEFKWAIYSFPFFICVYVFDEGQTWTIYKKSIQMLFVSFSGRFAKMKVSGDYFVTVIEDTRSNSIIGSATLVVEHKFIHECGSVGFMATFCILFLLQLSE